MSVSAFQGFVMVLTLAGAVWRMECGRLTTLKGLEMVKNTKIQAMKHIVMFRRH